MLQSKPDALYELAASDHAYYTACPADNVHNRLFGKPLCRPPAFRTGAIAVKNIYASTQNILTYTT